MIKKATDKEVDDIAKLASIMWHSQLDELEKEFNDLLRREQGVIFLKYLGNELIGFAQCQLRYDYVEGTNSSPVGYLEGVLVKEGYRHRGYAQEILKECEKWAKEQGCTEFASDCDINNEGSLGFHLHSGFTEVNRVICFTKKLQ